MFLFSVRTPGNDSGRLDNALTGVQQVAVQCQDARAIRGYIHQFSNLELDWLACDADGFVAMFSSAGFGAVPEESVAAAEALDAALDRIKALPVTGEATLISARTTPDDWIATARRGFFAFDWVRMRDRYQLAALPSRPIHIDEIPDEGISDVAKRVRIPVRFSQLRWIDWNEAGRLSSDRPL